LPAVISVSATIPTVGVAGRGGGAEGRAPLPYQHHHDFVVTFQAAPAQLEKVRIRKEIFAGALGGDTQTRQTSSLIQVSALFSSTAILNATTQNRTRLRYAGLAFNADLAGRLS